MQFSCAITLFSRAVTLFIYAVTLFRYAVTLFIYAVTLFRCAVTLFIYAVTLFRYAVTLFIYAVMLFVYAVTLFRCALPRAVPAGRARLGTKASSISRWPRLSFFTLHGTYGNQTENNVNMFLIVNFFYWTFLFYCLKLRFFDHCV